MKVKVKKLREDAVIPYKKHKRDAAYDLTAVTEKQDKGYVEFGFGLSFDIPEGYVGLVFPRSSVSNLKMSLSNHVGVIDSGFLGEVTARFKPSTTGTGKYNVGDRVAQLMILPIPEVEFEEVDKLNDSDRGEGGYGSTN